MECDIIFKIVSRNSISAVSYTHLDVYKRQTEYTAGEELDLDGMKVTVKYSNGEEKEITEGYEVSGYDKTKKMCIRDSRKVTGSGPQQDVSGLLEAGDIIDVSYNIKYTTGPDKMCIRDSFEYGCPAEALFCRSR